MSKGATFEEPAGQPESASASATGGPHDLYRHLFQTHPSALLLFDCATLQLADCNLQARTLLLPPEVHGAGLPRLTDCLRFDDPLPFAEFCNAPAAPRTELRARVTGLHPGTVDLPQLLVTLQRLPSAHGNLCQATLHTPAPADANPEGTQGAYASLFAHAGIGLTVIDRSLRILSMNPTIRSWFPQIKLDQKPFCYASFNTPPRDSACSYCPAVKVFQDGHTHYATTSTPTPGGVRHYSMIATPVFAADGTVCSVIETAEDVTDRLLLEKRSAEKSRNLQAVLDNAPIAIWFKGVDGRFRFVNRTFCRQMGISEEQFLAAGHFSDLLSPQAAAGCARSDAQCLANDETHLSRETFDFAEGKPHLLSVTKAQLKGEDGEVLGVVGLGVDITDQELSAERLRLLTDSFLRFGPDTDANINILSEVTGKILGASCTLFNLLEDGTLRSVGQWRTPSGYRAPDRAEGHICYDLIRSGGRHPRVIRDLHLSRYAQSDPNILRHGFRSYIGVPVCWGDQTVGVLCALFAEDFEPSAADLSFMIIVAAALGVEEARRRSERAQRRSERRYHALFSQAGEGVFVMSEAGVLLELNQAFAAMHGYSVAEMSGMDLSRLDAGETLRKVPERLRRLLAGEHLTFEVEHFHRDGRVIQLEASSSLIDCDGEPNIISFHRDITLRKRQEAALKKSEHEFRLLADAIPQLVWICGANGENIFTNDKWAAYTGLTREDSLGSGWGAAFHPEDLQAASEAWQKASQGAGDYALESRLRDADGLYRWWLVRGVPVRDEGGTVLKWFGTCTDIDHFQRAEEHRRSLEKQFQQAQKLESLGVLAGGIAHDFNNILSIISGYCSLLNLDPQCCAAYLPEVERAVERAAELCRQMLAYAGKTKFVRTRIDLVVLMEGMVRMLRSTLGQNAVIRFDRTADIFLLMGDSGQLRQVVMNLIINASEAIGEAQGEIRVALDCRRLEAESPVVDHLGKEIPAGVYACLEVSDNGCGMDEETRLRIFEPFFSTKFSGRGLGMSAVLGIINTHGGALQLESHPGQGTRFRIYLPVQEEESAEAGSVPEPAAPAPFQGNGKVLLVEDEPMVRGLAATMLKKLGYEVVEAADGKEGLERYREGGGRFRFVVTDLGMPVMDGYQMFRELKRLDPALPVVITTGFGDVDVTSRISGEDIAGFISKPYNFLQLKEALGKVVLPAVPEP
jgi:PAS domain S-box-containing protein